MRKLLLFVLLISSPDTFSQTLLSWEWQNPKPQGNTIRCSHFVNSVLGFAVTDNSIMLKTTNGGSTWVSHSPSLGTATFNDIQFVNSDTGYIVCNNGKIIKSVNGGSTWTFQPSVTNNDLTGVHFVNSMIGFAVGNEGTIVRTTNGGVEWTLLPRPDTIVNLKDVKFINESTGYITGRNFQFVSGAVPVFKTTDAGNSWVRQSSSYMLALTICVKDSNTIFVGGHFGEINKTTNGGVNWYNVNYHGYASVNSICFIDDTTAIAAGSDGYIIKSTNSGDNWTMTGSPFTNQYEYFTVSFANESKGFLMGEKGHILETQDGGNSYDTLSKGLRSDLREVQFINDQTGYAVGNRKTLLKTTDNGLSWQTKQYINTTIDLVSLFFLNEDTGYVGVSLGQIAKTTDGGETFTYRQLPSTQNMHSIFFVNNDTGYAGGKNNFFYRTVNAGTNWTRLYPDSGYFFGTFTDIVFLNSTTGIASNTNGRMYKTTNSGDNWIIEQITVNDTAVGGINGIYLINDTLGYGAGKSGKIIKTTDAGNTWSTDSTGDYHFNKIFFTDMQTGYACGVKIISGGGAILKTTNGGLSWEEQVTYTSSAIKSIFFTTENIGHAVGDNGTIIRTMTAGNHPLITNLSGNNSSYVIEYLLDQNYPNPFNPYTIISFRIPAQSKVTLKVYDILGREVSKLIDKILPQGKFNVRFEGNALASGIYFYHLEVESERLMPNKFSEVKKMVLVK